MLRPATGFATWPASADGRGIAIGAAALAGTAARLAVVASDASPRRVRFLTSATWQGPYSATGITQASPRIKCLTPLVWFVTNDDGDDRRFGDGAASRSVDGGLTWAANLTDMQDVARASDGRLWAIAHSVTDWTQTKVYYSIDNGANWILAHTFGTGLSPIAWRGIRIICHPNDPNKVCVIGVERGVNAGKIGRATTDPTQTANWSETNTGSTTDTTTAGNGLDRFKAAWLTNGRIVLTKLAPIGGAPSILTSDDNGATWTTRHSEAAGGAGPYYVLAGVSGAKIVVWRRDDSGGTPASRPLVSDNSGVSFAELAVSSFEVITGDTSSRGDSGAVYDPPDDALYVIDDDALAKSVWRLTPVSVDGVWTNITLDLDATSWAEEAAAIIPRS